MSISFWDK